MASALCPGGKAQALSKARDVVCAAAGLAVSNRIPNAALIGSKRHGKERTDRSKVMAKDLASAGRLDKHALRPLLQRKDAPASFWLLGHISLLALSSLLLWSSLGSWWLVATLPLQGLILIFLFAPLHEAIHGTAFASAWKNRWLGWFCGLWLVLPPNYFRAFHLTHHAHTQDPAKDPELITPKPETWRQALVYHSGFPYWKAQTLGLLQAAAGRLQGNFITSRAAPVIKREARIVLAIYATFAAGSLLLWTDLLLWLWIIPALIGQPILRAYLLAEHWDCPQVPDMRANTRTTLTNSAVRFLAWNMPYHAEHHAYASVPFHALPKLHRLIEPELQVISPGYLSVQRSFWKRILS